MFKKILKRCFFIVCFLLISINFTKGVGLKTNIRYELMEDKSGNKIVVPVLFTSCAASPTSIMRYDQALESALNEGKIDSIEDEYGYYWADLKIDDEEPINTEYYSVVGLFFYNMSELQSNNDELYLTKYASKTSGNKIDSSVEENVSSKWYWNFYDTTNKDIIRRKDNGDIQYEQVAANFSTLDGQGGVDENVEYARKIKKYLALPAGRKINVNSNAIMPFNAKFLIDKDKNKIICKYYLEGNYEKFLQKLSGKQVCWSTILSIKMLNGKPQSESHLVWTSYQLFKDIYGTNDGIWSWGNGTKGIGGIGLSGANDFDNILYNDERNKIILTVNYYIKKNGNYEKYTNDVENNEKVEYQYGGSYAEVPKERLGIVSGYRLVSYNNGTQKSLGRVKNNCSEIYDNGTKYSYKFARFGYDDNSMIAAEDNLSQKIKANVVNFCGGAEHLVVNFYYDPAENPPRYKIKYVDESGNEIATSSSEKPIPKNGVTVDKKSIDGYRYKGVLTSKVNMGSLNKASVDVKNVTNKNASTYISYEKKDVLVVFVYSKITYYLRVQHAIYNDTGGNYENLLSLIDINKDFKQEKVTNFSSKSLINNAYYQYILKSNKTDVKLSEKKYKTTNALYKFNSMYFLRKMYNFPNLSSTYESGDGKNENGEVNVTLSKNNGTKIGAILTYFYDQFPKRTVNVYRKYIDDKNNEIALISPAGKYTVNNFEIYKENQNFLRGIFYYGEKSTMPSVANNLKYITANEKDIYEYNGDVKITYYNGSNDESPISNNYTEKGLGTSISISSTNSKNKKQIDIVFYYTKKTDPEWITVCPELNFKTVADYLKNAEGKENVATNTCKEKDKTYECTDNDTTTQELVVPIGEDIKPIVNVPKVILIDSLSYSYDNTRGGIWQEVSVKNGKYNLRVVGYKALVLTEVKIKQNDGSNFVSLLSEDKAVYSRSNMANNSILSTELVNSNLGKNIGEALSKKFEYSGSSRSAYENHVYKYATSLTEINNYITNEIAGSNVIIDTDAYNGVKSAYATVKYKAVNIGITDFSYYSNISPYLKEGSSSSVLGGDNSNNESGDYERTTKDSVKKKEYSTNSSYVNVYAPLSLSIAVEGINTVDHTIGDVKSTLIQNNAKLKVTATIKSLTSYTKMSIQHIKDKYLKAYYYKFGFKVNYNGKTYESGSWIRGGESIEVLVNDSRLDNDNNTTTSVVSDYMNEIVCMAVTKNIPSYKNEDLTTIYDHYSSSNEITIPTDCKDSNETTTNNEWSETLKSNNKVKQDAYYAVKATKRIASIGRIYDFRITDCTDVDFKSVFRDSSKSGVNSLSGIVYFSGIKELEIFNSSTSNVLTNRKSPYTIPLGPYKHTNSNYVDAPKMGYRISFDVKTTGKYVTTSKAANELNSKYQKYVKITPSYYYIKKDGTGYNENITLYYKNSSNKYVKFIDSGFKISYKPNDGYRNVTNLGITNITDMFTDKYVTLEVSSHDGFILNIDSMCTNYSGYVQSWYGEFKLPNTTIAVADGGSVTKPLTDGYIGVKFDIKCIYKYDTQITEVSYNTPNKNASGTNTTQWDYEGYLGFKNAGKDVTGNDGLYLQFPKGKLMIPSQPVYEQIRGTVVFFDLDNRASNDFE